MKRVSLIVAINSDGEVLMGKRRDSGKWTLPGGHLNEGETPVDGAKRELKEETGLDVDAEDLKMVDQRELNGSKFFTFQCEVSGTPSGKDDPDQECSTWKFFDVSNGIPKEVHENMAGPRDKKKNVLTDVVGLAKMQALPGFPKLGIDDRRETPIIYGEQAANTKAKQISWQLRQAYPDESKADMDDYGQDVVNRSQGAVVSNGVGVNTSFVHSNQDVVDRFSRPITPTSDLGTKLHEDFHQMMGRVENKHGRSARQILAHNLWNAIPYGETGGAHIDYGHFTSSYLPEERRPEEAIANFHNYLNDAGERERYHKGMGHSDKRARDIQAGMKTAFKHLVDMSKHVDKSWMRRKMSRKEIEGLMNPAKPQFSPPPPGAKPTIPGKTDLPHSPETIAPPTELTKHDTPEFQSWFQGSKVATPEGQPLRVYHGTSSDVDFNTFKIGNRGAWFSTDPSVANDYAKENDSQRSVLDHSAPGYQFKKLNTVSRVIPAYLSLKNPYKMTPEDLKAHQFAENYARHQGAHFAQLKAAGHDGVDFGNGNYVAFHPHQIKGVFNERPTAHKAFMKSEDLKKMALIHDDPSKPMTVYRVQDQYGQGPYAHSGVDLDDGSKTTAKRTPGPQKDFTPREWNNNRDKLHMHFGFEKPEHAHEWFGDKMKDLEAAGFQLTPIQAHKVYRSKTGKQVAFLPAPEFKERYSRGLVEKWKARRERDRQEWATQGIDLDELEQRAGLTKHEESDEVMRLLMHPNKDERRMALKLGTVNDKHLSRAFYDEDPGVARAALDHPAMSHDSLMSLMRMPQSTNLQLAGMQHPLFNKEHLRALYEHHATGQIPEVMQAITHHPELYPELIQDMFHDGNSSRALIANQNTPPDVIRDVIERHFMPGNDQDHPRRYEVMEALQHPNATPQLAELAIKHGDEGIKLAAAKSPNLPLNVIEDILKRGHIGNHEESFLRSALLGSKFASEKHLDMGLEDTNPLVRSAVFNTQSPSLSEKHVNRAIEQGHPHTILMALKSKAATPAHLAKLANHPNEKVRALGESYKKKTAIVKYEEDLSGWLKTNNLSKGNLEDVDPNSDIVSDMLGYDHNKLSTFEAAKFLIAGNTPSLEQIRRALWQADGDVEEAALIAYGMDVTEANLRALRAVRDLREHKKSQGQPVSAKSVEPGVEEASETAEAIQRAFDDSFVFPVKLGGKHSEGSMLARDNRDGGVYLLKPGSGGISPAAGDQEESASQSRREAGFWHMADAWGLGNSLPQTDLVIIDGKEYAAIHLLPFKYKTLDKLKKRDPNLPAKLLGPYLSRGLLHKWAILDFVLGNPDRHANNLMADDTGDAPQADVKLIDHGSAMAGDDFDPANDQNSFVPFYLRTWATGKFSVMTIEQKLKAMPRVDDHMAAELHDWLASLSSHELQARLLRYGINPEPAEARLARLKALSAEEPVDLAINKLWVTV